MNDDTDNVFFYRGGERVSGGNVLASVQEKIAEFMNIKNVSFLLGAGASSDCIPSMEAMQETIATSLANDWRVDIMPLYKEIESTNLEEKLTVLHAKKHYLTGISNSDPDEVATVNDLIEFVENSMYSKINIDLASDDAKKCLDIYKKFYRKIALRNKDLSRICVFTTNNDLLNEKSLDSLNINYNNGFGGGLERVFNPARFHYTFSKKIDANLEKFEPLDNMVYLYKLHGSISWVEKEGNSLFNVHEIPVVGGEAKGDDSHVLIYPTPLKQSQSLGTPYADLIREFQSKLSLPNSVLFIIGYSFSDEHLNNIIYQSLASNSAISVVLFGECKSCPLAEIPDNRIYRIYGLDEEQTKIHYFKYIVDELLPNGDDDKENKLLDAFASSIGSWVGGKNS